MEPNKKIHLFYSAAKKRFTNQLHTHYNVTIHAVMSGLCVYIPATRGELDCVDVRGTACSVATGCTTLRPLVL